MRQTTAAADHLLKVVFVNDKPTDIILEKKKKKIIRMFISQSSLLPCFFYSASCLMTNDLLHSYTFGYKSQVSVHRYPRRKKVDYYYHYYYYYHYLLRSKNAATQPARDFGSWGFFFLSLPEERLKSKFLAPPPTST